MDQKPVRIFQIYFDEKSKANCFDEWETYDNSEGLTEYFENSVIVDLINKGAHKKSEYFGVLSHDFKPNRYEWMGEMRLFPIPSNIELAVTTYKNDCYSFQKKRQNPNIVTQADGYHPGFSEYMKIILNEVGFMSDIPKTLDKIILFNYFICKSEIYEQYVNELLIPAIEVMKTMPGLYNNANYKKNVDEKTLDRFERAYGKRYYPYHPFICERLPSLFFHKYSQYSFRQIF